VYRLAGVFPEPAAEGTRRYVNAKVVLLGEGTVGKTSLAHRLIEDRYVVQDRTHGMKVWRLNLPLPPDATLEREALLWDLAGQEDYRLIHQLFLEQTALALLLINPQKEDPFVEAGEWLKALMTAANDPAAEREAARLLIFSQVDVGGMKLGNAKIDRFREEHGFAGWLQTSAKTGANCSDQENKGQPSKLKELIAASVPWHKLPWTSTPRVLAELKNAVMAMRDNSDIRLLRFPELAQRLEHALPGEKFDESDLRTAVKLLANHGLARLLKFGDLVLLRPDLINGYAGAVIRAARAHTDEIGCVLEVDIYRDNFDFAGVERLTHRSDEELLLRALVQTFLDHSLCIAEDTPHGRHLVFPSQYRREKDTPKNPDIFVSYTFSGEWQTIWTTLVVRLWYSQEFAHRELWRNAAEFASPKGHTLGLLIKKDGDGSATLSLYFDARVSDEWKVIFIEYAHRHLARYAF
jgi:GTPase SAR1 family protein